MTIPTFPTLSGLAFPVKRTPVWNTIKQPSISGLETRFQLQSFPRWSYELTVEFLRNLSATDLQTLLGFYNALGGAAGVFQFADTFTPDNAVANQGFGTGDGSTVAFQLVRALGSFVEPVFAPTGTPAIKDNGSTVSGTAYSIVNGVVTFNTPPAAGHALTWTGNYDWLCRFDDDSCEFENFMSGFWAAKSLKFTTVKL